MHFSLVLHHVPGHCYFSPECAHGPLSTLKHLQHFLGFANFFYHFIWDYSLVVAHLTTLTDPLAHCSPSHPNLSATSSTSALPSPLAPSSFTRMPPGLSLSKWMPQMLVPLTMRSRPETAHLQFLLQEIQLHSAALWIREPEDVGSGYEVGPGGMSSLAPGWQ